MATKTKYACPTCGAQIIAGNHKLECSANGTHVWTDIAVFMGLNPAMKYEESKPPMAPQTNHVKVETSVPQKVKEQFEAKFGDRANATLSGFVQMITEGEVLVVPESDLQRIKERFGKRPESSGELFGILYSLSMDLETEKLTSENARKDLLAYEGRNPNSVLIDLGPLYGAVLEKARDQGETAKMFLERSLKTALENNWF